MAIACCGWAMPLNLTSEKLSMTGFVNRATSEACHFWQGESPCLEFKGVSS